MNNTSLEKYRYYIDYFQTDFQNIEKYRPWLTFDESGVVVSSIKRLKEKFKLDIPTSETYFYHPCEIAQAVCAYYDMLLTDNSNHHRELLLANVTWLKENYTEYKDAYVYPFPYAIKSFGEKPGWISGMYQGIILSAFVRAFIIFQDDEYLHFMQKVYNSYQLPLGEEYGFKVEDKYGLWFEESMLTPPTHILNGFVYAIFGLYDYFKLTNDQAVKKLIDRCFDTLTTTLPKYDMGYWSYYDLNGTIASYSYHNRMHIPLLKVLYKISGIPVFNEFAIKWERYSKSSYCIFRKKIYSGWQKYLNRK